ncbi:hypothetical protein Tco_0227580 [Tanacetum coccineum]
MEEYKDKLPEGFDRMLWGDLMIMFNQGDTADFWDTQQNWKLISWKLHSSSGVHTINDNAGHDFHKLWKTDTSDQGRSNTPGSDDKRQLCELMYKIVKVADARVKD